MYAHCVLRGEPAAFAASKASPPLLETPSDVSLMSYPQLYLLLQACDAHRDSIRSWLTIQLFHGEDDALAVQMCIRFAALHALRVQDGSADHAGCAPGELAVRRVLSAFGDDWCNGPLLYPREVAGPAVDELANKLLNAPLQVKLPLFVQQRTQTLRCDARVASIGSRRQRWSVIQALAAHDTVLLLAPATELLDYALLDADGALTVLHTKAHVSAFMAAHQAADNAGTSIVAVSTDLLQSMWYTHYESAVLDLLLKGVNPADLAQERAVLTGLPTTPGARDPLSPYETRAILHYMRKWNLQTPGTPFLAFSLSIPHGILVQSNVSETAGAERIPPLPRVRRVVLSSPEDRHQDGILPDICSDPVPDSCRQLYFYLLRHDLQGTHRAGPFRIERVPPNAWESAMQALGLRREAPHTVPGCVLSEDDLVLKTRARQVFEQGKRTLYNRSLRSLQSLHSISSTEEHELTGEEKEDMSKHHDHLAALECLAEKEPLAFHTPSALTARLAHQRKEREAHSVFTPAIRECTVCYDREGHVALPCGHSYCAPCVCKLQPGRWPGRCPECRRVFKREGCSIMTDGDAVPSFASFLVAVADSHPRVLVLTRASGLQEAVAAVLEDRVPVVTLASAPSQTIAWCQASPRWVLFTDPAHAPHSLSYDCVGVDGETVREISHLPGLCASQTCPTVVLSRTERSPLETIQSHVEFGAV